MKKTALTATVVVALGILAPAWLAASGRQAGYENEVNFPLAHLVHAPDDHQLSRSIAPADGVEEIVLVRRFRLDQPYGSRWSKEKSLVEGGSLVVIRVRPEYVFPHEAATPILYAGNRPVERVNVGYQDGHVIGIVAGDFDPATTPVYFGSPDFPERVTVEKGALELQNAESRGLLARPPLEVSAALAMGAEMIELPDGRSLFAEAGELIEEYAPSEVDLGLELQMAPSRFE